MSLTQEKVTEILEDQVSKLKQQIEDKIEQGNEKAQNKYNDKLDSKFKEEFSSLKKEYDEANKKLQEHVETLDVSLQKMLKEGTPSTPENVKAQLKSYLDKVENGLPSKFDTTASRDFRFKISDKHLTRKAADTMTIAGNYTGEVIPRQYITPAFIRQNRTPIRDLFPQGTTNRNVIRMPNETAKDGAVDAVNEGAAKPLTDNDFNVKDFRVEKVAGRKKISEEMLDDTEWISSFITEDLTAQILIKENQLLLRGTGVQPQIEGITINADSYTNSGVPVDANATILDLIIQASAQIETSHLIANGMLLHPVDYAAMLRTKATDGQYIGEKFFNYQTNRLEPYGIPVFRNTDQTQGDYIIGDWSQGVIYDRMGFNVRIYDQNEDDAVNNLVMFVAEQRMALVKRYNDAWITGTIATDVAKIQNGTT